MAEERIWGSIVVRCQHWIDLCGVHIPKFPGFLWIGDVGWGYILRTSLQTAFPCGDALLSRTADIYRFIDLAGLLYGASVVNPTHYQMTLLGI
jgi:hypothetical protein